MPCDFAYHGWCKKFKRRKGKKFGKLTPIAIVGSKRNSCLWKCLCNCGKYCEVTAVHLLSGNSKSCGCLRWIKNTKHGHCSKGESLTYKSWGNMKSRCFNKNTRYYKDYGGRGITVCSEWIGEHGFENFLKDMKERPAKTSIHRIENDGNYEPTNCVWATSKVQMDNRIGKVGIEFIKSKKLYDEFIDFTKKQWK
jgi:hypothetical protein